MCVIVFSMLLAHTSKKDGMKQEQLGSYCLTQASVFHCLATEIPGCEA